VLLGAVTFVVILFQTSATQPSARSGCRRSALPAKRSACQVRWWRLRIEHQEMHSSTSSLDVVFERRDEPACEVAS